MTAIGQHLAGLRQQRGLTQKQVATRMGLTSVSSVYTVEKPGSNPCISTLIAYCNAIGARIHIGLEEAK